MSSRVFRARTGHTPEKPQRCGLSDREIHEGDLVMYLVCRGSDARPEYQIRVVREEETETTWRGRTRRRVERDYATPDGRQFRSVFSGWEVGDDGKRRKVFSWQERHEINGQEVWMPVNCWSRLVLAEVAADLGYEVRRRKDGRWQMTRAFRGDRNVGNEHSVSNEPESPLAAVARAFMDEAEQGLAPPKESEVEG